MSDDFSPTANYGQPIPVGGVASDDVKNILLLRLDPTTKRLFVVATLSGEIGTDLEGGGKISVGTTRVEVTFTGTPTKSILITADKDNTGILFVGKSDVTNLGANAIAPLVAGQSMAIKYDDVTNAIFVVSDTASQNFWKGAVL